MVYDHDTYNSDKGNHSYDVEAIHAETKARITFNVIATNRDQACRIVERGGHKVRSVNMTG